MIEDYDHTMICPECGKHVQTVPAEGVRDQLLRGCPDCGAVFWEELEGV